MSLHVKREDPGLRHFLLGKLVETVDLADEPLDEVFAEFLIDQGLSGPNAARVASCSCRHVDGMERVESRWATHGQCAIDAVTSTGSSAVRVQVPSFCRSSS